MSRCRPRAAGRLPALAAALVGAALLLMPGAAAGSLGANKFDLMIDYVGAAPAGAPSEGYARVRQAMARKAIADARDVGLGFFRVAVTGYFPVAFNDSHNDLALWRQEPPRFWAAIDRMFDDLDAAGMRLVPSFIWNLGQFAALGNDDVGTFVREPTAPSRRLLAQFINDFIARYRGRKTILFYELGNEMNLLADLDHRKGCHADPCVAGNFTTAEMNRFAGDVAGLIKSLDPSRSVTSGYSLPRPAATHLAVRPAFAGGPDWTPDTAAEFRRYVAAVHAPFDIISIHAYAGDIMRPNGKTAGERIDAMRQAAAVAQATGKKLFIGEFGDPGGATRYMIDLLDEVVRDRIDYAALWVWEFYQTSTYETRNTEPTKFDVEPGYGDDVIRLLMRTQRRLGAPAPRSPGEPRVVLTWPLPCAEIDQPLDLYAVASDGARPVKAVEFLIDGARLATVSGPPYRIRFDPAGRGARTAEFTARAAGAAGTTAFRSTVHLNHDIGACNFGE